MKLLVQEILKKCICLLIFLLTVLLLGNNTNAQTISLQDLSAFSEYRGQWDIVDDININPLKKGDVQIEAGNGVVVGSASQTDGSKEIISEMVHGDISVEFDFMVAHNTSSEILLQGRYGIHLADSWGKVNLKEAVSGSIVQSFTSSSQNLPKFGNIARMDVAGVPGVWQNLKIVFEAPEFNESGEKTRKARFVKVELNGVVIQENQFMPRHSQGSLFEDEVNEGPLVFRINNGNIALRNIRYTKFSDEQVALENLTYSLYMDKFLDEEFIFWGGGNENFVPMPDFDSYKVDNSGDIGLIHTRMTQGLENDFALVFEGRLSIPKSGRYHFEAVENGLGSFVVNGEELFRWNGIHEKGRINASMELNEGLHDIRLNYINHRQPYTGIFIEGNGIKRQPLHEESSAFNEGSIRPIVLNPKGSDPLIQRSFIFYEEKKLLTCMNVGHLNGVHYAVNLSTGSLLQAWKGEFGDVTSMWHGRGEDQVLQPLGSVLRFTDEQQVFQSKDQNIHSTNDLEKGDYEYLGYDLTTKGEPVYNYRVDNIDIQDAIIPNSGEKILTRSLIFKNRENTEENIWFKIATAHTIESIRDGLFSIANKSYYVEVSEGADPVILNEGDGQSLFVPLKVDRKEQGFQYSLIW